ncbi:hypothetical protein ACWD8L_22210 [Streptomyces sp. NPDC005133]
MCSRIAEKLKKIDAAAFEGHVGFIRPELLDRRLSDGDHGTSSGRLVCGKPVAGRCSRGESDTATR